MAGVVVALVGLDGDFVETVVDGIEFLVLAGVGSLVVLDEFGPGGSSGIHRC